MNFCLRVIPFQIVVCICNVILPWSFVVQGILWWPLGFVYSAAVTGTTVWFYIRAVPCASTKVTSDSFLTRQHRQCWLSGMRLIRHCYCCSLLSAGCELLRWPTTPCSSSALSGIIKLLNWWHKPHDFATYSEIISSEQRWSCFITGSSVIVNWSCNKAAFSTAVFYVEQ